MGMKPAYNLVWGEDTERPMKDDPEKTYTKWHNLGVLFVDKEKGRMSLKLETLPLSPKFEGWCNLFPIKKRGNGAIDDAKDADGVDIEDMGAPINMDDIPF